MNFGKLKAALKRLINRKDLTDDLAGDFVNRAIGDCQRVARLTPNEQLLIAEGWDGVHNSIIIPGDYLELSDIFTDDGVLDNVDRQRFFTASKEGAPSVYTKAGDSWLLRPTPTPGTRIYVQYFAETPELVDDSDTNTWTKACFSAALYTAATLAADFFQMEDTYVTRFQGKADAFMQAIEQQEYDDRWSGTHTVGRVTGRGDF